MSGSIAGVVKDITVDVPWEREKGFELSHTFIGIKNRWSIITKISLFSHERLPDSSYCLMSS